MKAYCGYIKDSSLLKSSASGGLATAMALEVIRCGLKRQLPYIWALKAD